MENIYTQAIADAKAVRESALANAKAAIQEAFEPKIKAMLKKHIVENEEDEMEEGKQEISGYNEKGSRMKTIKHATGYEKAPAPQGAIEDLEEEYDEMDEMETASSEMMEDPGNLDETSLDEILAELDALDETDSEEDESDEEDELDEAYKMGEAKEEDEEDESEEDETEEESEEDEDGKESTEETKVVDITLGDLVDAIKAAMGSETSAEPTEMEPAKDDDISLDEILAELEEEMKEEGAGADSSYMDEAKKKAKKDKEQIAGHKGAAVKAAEKETAYKTELKEAKKAIEAMRAELNEVNLLNAKLLYVNKIFKAKSLTEAQKVKVLNAFDKATTVKEVKNTYSIVSEAITAAPKKQLKESFGFASKPAGVAPKTNTMESDPFIARMQKLAGL